MEEETQRQGGFDREVRVLRWRAPRARSLRFLGCDGRPGQPDGDVAPTDQGSLVGRPVSDAVFRLVFRMDSRLHPSSLVWVPLNLTLDLCNNAAAGRGRRGPDTARLCAAARAQATRPDRPAIVAHAATGWADAAEHTHAPARASGAGDGFATRSRQVRAPHHLIRVPIETPACRCWE